MASCTQKYIYRRIRIRRCIVLVYVYTRPIMIHFWLLEQHVPLFVTTTDRLLTSCENQQLGVRVAVDKQSTRKKVRLVGAKNRWDANEHTQTTMSAHTAEQSNISSQYGLLLHVLLLLIITLTQRQSWARACTSLEATHKLALWTENYSSRKTVEHKEYRIHSE